MISYNTCILTGIAVNPRVSSVQMSKDLQLNAGGRVNFQIFAGRLVVRSWVTTSKSWLSIILLTLLSFFLFIMYHFEFPGFFIFGTPHAVESRPYLSFLDSRRFFLDLDDCLVELKNYHSETAFSPALFLRNTSIPSPPGISPGVLLSSSVIHACVPGFDVWQSMLA